jgi:hypothetical protein
MAYIPLRKIGSGGIVSDADPYDLELTQFPDGNNVTFHSGRIGKALGHSVRESLSFSPTAVQGWLYGGNNTLVIGSLNKLYRFDGTTVSNVTSLAAASGPSPFAGPMSMTRLAYRLATTSQARQTCLVRTHWAAPTESLLINSSSTTQT